ncbi:hypothetical protein [Staphylococcus gallinarum]|uniref:hypothetical protein n=1 Tax=Staphylococcus gallinarum TaxID=1293 RepID=UPI002442A665|nr:hypothetical protein [Staphylococcus gallinarum]
MLNVIIIAFLIIVLIVNRYRIKNTFYLYLSRIKNNYSLRNIKTDVGKLIRDIKPRVLTKMILDKIFTINSWRKLGFLIVIILVLILINFKLNDLIKFIFLEYIMIFLAILLLSFLKKEHQSIKIFFGQLYIPFLGVFGALEIFLIDLDRQEISFHIFYIFMTTLMLSLYISISLYYSVDNKNFKLIHMLFCYLNMGLVCVIMFTYIGYGFMVYDIKNQNLKPNEGILNIKGPENLLNYTAVFISYGLDNLSQGSGIVISKTKEVKFINTNEILFGLVSKVFVSTYIALVLAFLGNTLFNKSKSSKDIK